MLEAGLANATLFRTIIDTITSLEVMEANLRCSSSGIVISPCGANYQALCTIELRRDAPITWEQ